MESPPLIPPRVPEKVVPEREALIGHVRARIGHVDESCAAALRDVDRARFVEPEFRHLAWLDEPLPLHTPHGQHVATISAPHVYALAFHALGLSRGDRFLELGSGSGYGAALAASIVGPEGTVTTVEVDPHLARRTAGLLSLLAPEVVVVEDDGIARTDLLRQATCCSITFAVASIDPFLSELPSGAALVAPLCVGDEQRLLLVRRTDGGLFTKDLGAVRFVASRSRQDLVLERPA